MSSHLLALVRSQVTLLYLFREHSHNQQAPRPIAGSCCALHWGQQPPPPAPCPVTRGIWCLTEGPSPVSALWNFLDQGVVLILVALRFSHGPLQLWVRLSAVTLPPHLCLFGNTSCCWTPLPVKPKARGVCS